MQRHATRNGGLANSWTSLARWTLASYNPRMRTPLTEDSWVDFHEQWLDPSASAVLYDQLLSEVVFEQRSVTIFGKVVAQPRLIGWCGSVGYRYSGLSLPPRATPACLTDVLDRVNRAADTEFNHLLLNLYRSGVDSMGMHADDEPELGRDPVVATLSLGATRRFSLKARRGGHRLDYPLGNGSLLIMGGRCQAEYVHGIPKTRAPVSPRLSITFRRIIGPGAVLS